MRGLLLKNPETTVCDAAPSARPARRIVAVCCSLFVVAAMSASSARAEGLPDGKYTFTTLASPNGLYPAGYFTFNVDISYENTDYFAYWVTTTWLRSWPNGIRGSPRRWGPSRTAGPSTREA